MGATAARSMTAAVAAPTPEPSVFAAQTAIAPIDRSESSYDRAVREALALERTAKRNAS